MTELLGSILDQVHADHGGRHRDHGAPDLLALQPDPRDARRPARHRRQRPDRRLLRWRSRSTSSCSPGSCRAARSSACSPSSSSSSPSCAGRSSGSAGSARSPGCCRPPTRATAEPRRDRGRARRRGPVRRGPRGAHRHRARDRARGGRRDRRDGPRRPVGRPAADDLLAADRAPRRRRDHPRRRDPGGRRAAARSPRRRSTPSASGPAIGPPSASPSRPTRSSSSSPRRTARSASSSGAGSSATSTRRSWPPRCASCSTPTGGRRGALGWRPTGPGGTGRPGAAPRRPRAHWSAAPPRRAAARRPPPDDEPAVDRGRPGTAVTRALQAHRPQLAPQARRDRPRDAAVRRPRPAQNTNDVHASRSRSIPRNTPTAPSSSRLPPATEDPLLRADRRARADRPRRSRPPST